MVMAQASANRLTSKYALNRMLFHLTELIQADHCVLHTSNNTSNARFHMCVMQRGCGIPGRIIYMHKEVQLVHERKSMGSSSSSTTSAGCGNSDSLGLGFSLCFNARPFTGLTDGMLLFSLSASCDVGSILD